MMYMEQSQLKQDVDKLRQSLGLRPEAMIKPPFVVVSGLPGTGKSFFCRKLAERFPLLILESDVLRKSLFSVPGYSAAESARLFSACHVLIEELLDKGISLIFDATNISERYRERLYHIGVKTEARLVLVRVEAPPELVYQRLQARRSNPNPGDRSDASWEVYRLMKPLVDKIQRNHFVVDTSRDITPVVDKIVRMLR